MSRIAVIYYSATGHVHKLAEAVAKGATDAGAEVRLRRVAELAPEAVIRRQDAWHEHYEATVAVVEEARLEDLEWADGFALGTPTRYGLPAAQLKEFIDQTGPLWVEGHLSNKALTAAHYQGHRLAQYASLLVARPTGSADGRGGMARSADPLALAPYDPPSYYRERSP
jgi:multimeric flavodoxin WrbA